MRVGGVVLLVLALSAVVTSEVIHNRPQLSKGFAPQVQEDAWKDSVPTVRAWTPAEAKQMIAEFTESVARFEADAPRWRKLAESLVQKPVGQKYVPREEDSPRAIPAVSSNAGGLESLDELRPENPAPLRREQVPPAQAAYKRATAAPTAAPTPSPIFTKVAEIRTAIETNHKKFVFLREQLLQEKADGRLTLGQAEFLLAHLGDCVQMLGHIESMLEPFAPFDRERSTYPANSEARLEMVEGRLTRLVHNRKRIWKKSQATVRKNEADWGLKTPVSQGTLPVAGSPRHRRAAAGEETLVDAQARFLVSEDGLTDSLSEYREEAAFDSKFIVILAALLGSTLVISVVIITSVAFCVRLQRDKYVLLRAKDLADIEAGFGPLPEDLLPAPVHSKTSRSSRSMPRLPSVQKVSPR